ncbi:hypothetical protein [Bartonella gabonensis]|uniref:hypothetical protein n=1 Tax=Bartonella gabonensis TaxID=2699889 RepID=UPI00158BCEAE|nr:hypothetical protein [Bartonella gabonensis]
MAIDWRWIRGFIFLKGMNLECKGFVKPYFFKKGVAGMKWGAVGLLRRHGNSPYRGGNIRVLFSNGDEDYSKCFWFA